MVQIAFEFGYLSFLRQFALWLLSIFVSLLISHANASGDGKIVYTLTLIHQRKLYRGGDAYGRLYAIGVLIWFTGVAMLFIFLGITAGLSIDDHKKSPQKRLNLFRVRPPPPPINNKVAPLPPPMSLALIDTVVSKKRSERDAAAAEGEAA